MRWSAGHATRLMLEVVEGGWMLLCCEVVLHAPSEWCGDEEQQPCEGAAQGTSEQAQAWGCKQGRETYHCLCGLLARAAWWQRRAADGLKRNLELLTCDGLALQRVVGADCLAYGAVLHQRRAGHVVEAEALDGAVQLRATVTSW